MHPGTSGVVGFPAGGGARFHQNRPEADAAFQGWRSSRKRFRILESVGDPWERLRRISLLTRIRIYRGAVSNQCGVTGDPSPRDELRADLKTRAGAQSSPVKLHAQSREGRNAELPVEERTHNVQGLPWCAVTSADEEGLGTEVEKDPVCV
ncbi:hypothetical protein H8959_010926 [Pygathrix nigripes]